MKVFIVFIVLILNTLVVFGTNISLKESFLYKDSESFAKNEASFLELNKFICLSFDKDQLKILDIDKVLHSYPKEIVHLYLKKHKNNFCYFAFSKGIKYIVSEFKAQAQVLIDGFVSHCIKGRNTKDRLCQEVDRDATLYDLSLILSRFCNRKSHITFRKVYCQLEQNKKTECSLYKGKGKGKDECPWLIYKDIKKNPLPAKYFYKSCRRPKRWRTPRC